MIYVLFFLSLFSGQATANVEPSRFFIGTSAFMLSHLDRSDEPPLFYQLNLGYQLTAKDVLSLELISWRYYAPLGSAWSSKEDKKYPGYASAKGAGLAYQRFLWRGLYTALHGAWFNQEYYNISKVKVGEGHQLFLTFRVGYRLSFFSKRFFVEPSFALTHWPVNTGLPRDFEEKEEKWGKFIEEPGLHIGFVF